MTGLRKGFSTLQQGSDDAAICQIAGGQLAKAALGQRQVTRWEGLTLSLQGAVCSAATSCLPRQPPILYAVTADLACCKH